MARSVQTVQPGCLAPIRCTAVDLDIYRIHKTVQKPQQLGADPHLTLTAFPVSPARAFGTTASRCGARIDATLLVFPENRLVQVEHLARSGTPRVFRVHQSPAPLPHRGQLRRRSREGGPESACQRFDSMLDPPAAPSSLEFGPWRT